MRINEVTVPTKQIAFPVKVNDDEQRVENLYSFFYVFSSIAAMITSIRLMMHRQMRQELTCSENSLKDLQHFAQNETFALPGTAHPESEMTPTV